MSWQEEKVTEIGERTRKKKKKKTKAKSKELNLKTVENKVKQVMRGHSKPRRAETR